MNPCAVGFGVMRGARGLNDPFKWEPVNFTKELVC